MWRREYKKGGDSEGGRKTERKEQVLVLKRAAMRSNGRGRTDWVVLSPLIVSRSTRTVCKGQRRARHRMVSACDGSPLQGSVKSHPDARPPTFILVSAEAKASKSSKFIVHVQVSWISFSRTRRFFNLVCKYVVDIQRSYWLRKNKIYSKYIRFEVRDE